MSPLQQKGARGPFVSWVGVLLPGDSDVVLFGVIYDGGHNHNLQRSLQVLLLRFGGLLPLRSLGDLKTTVVRDQHAMRQPRH